MRKSVLVVVPVAFFCLFTSGCPLNRTDDLPSESSANSSYNENVIGVPEEELQFSLSPDDSTPEFGKVTGSTGGALYIERDGYAYQLDPATLDVIDIPLDPVTKDPVTIATASPSEVPEQNVSSEVMDVETPDTSFTRVSPTETNKYPDTGIIWEEDE